MKEQCRQNVKIIFIGVPGGFQEFPGGFQEGSGGFRGDSRRVPGVSGGIPGGSRFYRHPALFGPS